MLMSWVYSRCCGISLLLFYYYSIKTHVLTRPNCTDILKVIPNYIKLYRLLFSVLFKLIIHIQVTHYIGTLMKKSYRICGTHFFDHVNIRSRQYSSNCRTDKENWRSVKPIVNKRRSKKMSGSSVCCSYGKTTMESHGGDTPP